MEEHETHEMHEKLCFCFNCVDPFLLKSLQNNNYVLPIIEDKGILEKMNNGTVKNKLLGLMDEYCDLVYVESNEIHFVRSELVNQLKRNPKFESFVLASFERGLKHAGLEVVASTHGGNRVKKWGLREETSWSTKKKKRSRRDDEDYRE